MKNVVRRFKFFLMVVLMIASSGLNAHAATVTGKVQFEGEVPVPAPINFGAEKQCAATHGDKMPVNEDLVVNTNNTVKWALVYVKEGAAGAYPAPAEAAEMDQTGCVFIPHVIGAMAGQKINFKNSDPVLHNVRSACKINKSFNIAQPIQGMTTAKTFASPEIGIQMRCDVHFWMKGYVHILANPFFSVTGDDGSFTIKDLPAGTYTLELWHETLGTQTQSVTVAEADAKEVNFTLKKA